MNGAASAAPAFSRERARFAMSRTALKGGPLSESKIGLISPGLYPVRDI